MNSPLTNVAAWSYGLARLAYLTFAVYLGYGWRTGLRADYIEEPREKGGLAYVTYWPSDFSALSLQGRYVRRS